MLVFNTLLLGLLVIMIVAGMGPAWYVIHHFPGRMLNYFGGRAVGCRDITKLGQRKAHECIGL